MPLHPDFADKPRCNCGVVGVYNHPKSAITAYYALHSLQHRGQEAAGIVSQNYVQKGAKLRSFFNFHKAEGLVLDVFSDPEILTEKLAGKASIAHNRYSTTGYGKENNIQPFFIKYRDGNLALAHNGNLANTRTLRKQLQDDGAIFQTTTDSEIFLHLIARSRKTHQIDQVREALQQTTGAFSLVIMTDDKLFAARDPHGFRPLSIGRIALPDGSYSYMVASETCAFETVNAEYIRDVEHNELIIIDQETVENGTIKSYQIQESQPESRHCIFEYIYFARPDSRIFGHSVDKVRRKLGKSLAEESPAPNSEQSEQGDSKRTIAVAVPDSANTATLGFAHRSQKDDEDFRFELGLIRSHYVGRTFIAPGQDSREMKVKTKFSTVRGVLKDRHVVLVDDSIVRGTTSKQLVKLVREASPASVHFRASSPPITHPCYYGMDFPSRKELIANHYESEEEIAEALDADTVRYLSVEKMMDSVPQEEGKNYCTACFTGHYPVPIDEKAKKDMTEE